MCDVRDRGRDSRREGDFPGETARVVAGMCAVMLAVAACDVTNPGRILDEDLSREQALPALVNGMASDFSLAINGGASGAVWYTGIMSGDLGLGAYQAEHHRISAGVIGEEWRSDYGWVNPIHEVRWIAEDGARRISEVLGSEAQNSPLLAEARLWAGYSNRLLGATQCRAVFDGGEPQPRTAYWERAEDHFSQAIQIAQASGATDVATAAYAGRASVRLQLGDLQAAMSDANQVPDGFVWEAKFDDVSQGGRLTNTIWHESHPRRNASAAFTWFEEYYEETGDPRVPSVNTGQNAGDGFSPLVRPLKYPNGTSDVPLSKGAEARLIEAEVMIRQGQWEQGLAKINALRSEVGVDPWEASNQREAYEALIKERGIVLWLEARRTADLYRYDRATEIYPDGYPVEEDPIFRNVIVVGQEEAPDHPIFRQMSVDGYPTCVPFSEVIVSTNPNL